MAAITVTATQTAVQANGMTLTLKVVTGAVHSASQPGATAGTHGAGGTASQNRCSGETAACQAARQADRQTGDSGRSKTDPAAGPLPNNWDPQEAYCFLIRAISSAESTHSSMKPQAVQRRRVILMALKSVIPAKILLA